MLGWLINLWNRLTGREERGLFRFWDGSKWRLIDPVLAYRQLNNNDDCQLLSDLAVARNPHLTDGKCMYPMAEVLAAEDRVRVLVRKVFGVQEWREDQAGLTLDETDSVLNDFFGYCNDLKKKRNPSPTSSAPTTSPAPCSSSDGENFPVGVDPDYCSSANESNAAAPTGQ